MAVIYLKHNTHGAKVACSVHEAEIDKKQGWVEFDPKIPAEVVAEIFPELVEETPSAVIAETLPELVEETPSDVIAEIFPELIEETPSEVVTEATPQVAPRRRGRPSLDELL